MTEDDEYDAVILAANDYADQRVMATKGRAGPVEVAAAADHLREVITAYGQVSAQRARNRAEEQFNAILKSAGIIG